MAAPRGLIRVGVALDDGLVGEVHDPLDGGAVALGDLVDLEGGEDEVVAGVLALLLRRWGRGGGHTRTLARESLELDGDTAALGLLLDVLDEGVAVQEGEHAVSLASVDGEASLLLEVVNVVDAAVGVAGGDAV